MLGRVRTWFGREKRSHRIAGRRIGVVIVGVWLRRRRVCCVDLGWHLRFERGLGRAMLREICGRLGRRLRDPLLKTWLWVGCGCV
jgi:hypothetical protein